MYKVGDIVRTKYGLCKIIKIPTLQFAIVKPLKQIGKIKGITISVWFENMTKEYGQLSLF